jgi:hypothetical protein
MEKMECSTKSCVNKKKNSNDQKKPFDTNGSIQLQERSNNSKDRFSALFVVTPILNLIHGSVYLSSLSTRKTKNGNYQNKEGSDDDSNIVCPSIWRGTLNKNLDGVKSSANLMDLKSRKHEVWKTFFFFLLALLSGSFVIP